MTLNPRKFESLLKIICSYSISNSCHITLPAYVTRMNEINVHRCVYPFPIVNFIYHQRYQFAFMTDLGLNKSRYHNSMYDFIYFRAELLYQSIKRSFNTDLLSNVILPTNSCIQWKFRNIHNLYKYLILAVDVDVDEFFHMT